jgi:PAS domain S-box-containing protein
MQSLFTDQTSASKTRHSQKIRKEANLNAIIENFDGYVWSIDTDLRYIILNTALRRKIQETFGVDAKPGDKVLDILEMIDAAKPKAWSKLYQEGFEGQTQRFVEEFKIAGKTSFYEISVNPIRDGEMISGLSCFARDITQEVMNDRRLKATEMRFRALIENSSDITVVLNSEGQIIYGSPSIEKNFGITPGEFTGASFYEFIHPEDIGNLAVQFMDLLLNPGKQISVQARAKTRDGRQIWTEGIVSNLLNTEGINGIVCNFRDITERVQASEAKRESEVKFRRLIENSSDIILMADAQGNFLYGSPSVQKYLGYVESDYLDQFCMMFVHPDSIDYAGKLLKDIIKNPGKLFTIYLSLKHKHGTEIPVEGLASNMLDVPGVNALVANFRDISERKKAEKIIKESEDLYRNLFNNSPLPIWVCDAGTLRFLEVNEAAIQQYGFSRKEFLKMTAFGLVPPHEHLELKQVWSGACNTNIRLQRNHLKRNGDHIFVEMLVHQVNYKGQDSYLVLANDITEKIRLQNQLIEEKLHRHQEIIKATIEATEKEREGIGRELHDNVTQILTTARLCLDCISNNHPSRDMIDRSRNTITSAIEEIRSLSKSMIQSFHREVGLKLSIEDLVEGVQIANKFVISLDFYLPDEQLLDDKLKMTVFRIVQEQLNNIIKHAEATEVALSIHQYDEVLSLVIVDNGKGFNVLEKRKGIGISNITNRAELFNGQVRIISAPGNGCRMEVSFRVR